MSNIFGVQRRKKRDESFEDLNAEQCPDRAVHGFVSQNNCNLFQNIERYNFVYRMQLMEKIQNELLISKGRC